jgi:hypothetical protein
MGVPPPPGSACGPVGASELASRFGLVGAPAEVEAQHAATVQGICRKLTSSNSGNQGERKL